MCVWQSVELFISQKIDSVSMQNGSCATEGVFTAVLQLWSSIPFEPCTSSTWTCRPWEVCEMCFVSTTAYRSHLTQWKTDRSVVGTDVQRKCDKGSIRSAAWDCSGLFRQSTINPYQLDRMHLFSLRRQQTAPEYLLQTSQMNE